MRHIAALVALASTTVMLVGCLSARYEPTSSQRFEPRPDDHPIAVFYDTTTMSVAMQRLIQERIPEAKPNTLNPAEYVTLGRVDYVMATLSTLPSQARDAADRTRHLGGDGIIIICNEDPHTRIAVIRFRDRE